MLEIEVSAGTVEYEDTGGDGPVLVLLHGLAMDGSLWRGVVADLREDHRCIVPTRGRSHSDRCGLVPITTALINTRRTNPGEN